MELRDRYRRFREWQQQPHQVAPLSEQEYDCATCGTHYQGNYCPRCGQSARIGRYSIKNALLLFLDVWGLGNRGMFRSIRDLILRPGYMIRDYLRGMQVAYFPPFKMFFLLLTLWLLVDSGLNIRGINRTKQNEAETEQLFGRLNTEESRPVATEESRPAATEESVERTSDEKSETKKQEIMEDYNRITTNIGDWCEKHSSLTTLVALLLYTFPLWLMIRRGPAIPDLRLSECFVAMVYITNMLIIYCLVPSLLCFSLKAEIIYTLLVMLLVVVPIRQLCGFSYRGTIWRVALSATFFIIAALMSIIGLAMLFLIYEQS